MAAKKRTYRYTQAQVKIHYQLRAKPAKKRTAKQKAQLRKLDAIVSRRGYEFPETVYSRTSVGVPLAAALPRGWGAQLGDLAFDPWAQRRSTLFAIWLCEQWRLDISCPLRPIRERIFDQQRATTEAHRINGLTDLLLLEELPELAVNADFKAIFNNNVRINSVDYVVKLNYKLLLLKKNSGEIVWRTVFSMSSKPDSIIEMINKTLRNWQNASLDVASEYGQYLVAISAYCQMENKKIYLAKVRASKKKSKQNKSKKHSTTKEYKERKNK